MGQLLSVKKRKGGVVLDLVVDVSPNADSEELKLHTNLASILGNSSQRMRALREYGGNTDILRQAMSAPKDDVLQIKAFSGILPNISLIKDFYDLSGQLGNELRVVFKFLADKNLREHQALLKQLADVLEFTLSFDYEKMMKPAIQNDFSYYRRYLAKMSHQVPDIQVQEAEAGLISMFIAQNLPMTITVENVIKGLAKESPELARSAINTIGVLANVTCDLALRPGVADDGRWYALRVMTSAVVLYDRVSTTGVFTRSSPVQTRKCLRTLHSSAQGGGRTSAQQLLNSVKYSTIHLKDGNTPGYVRTLLGN